MGVLYITGSQLQVSVYRDSVRSVKRGTAGERVVDAEAADVRRLIARDRVETHVPVDRVAALVRLLTHLA